MFTGKGLSYFVLTRQKTMTKIGKIGHYGIYIYIYNIPWNEFYSCYLNWTESAYNVLVVSKYLLIQTGEREDSSFCIFTLLIISNFTL